MLKTALNNDDVTELPYGINYIQSTNNNNNNNKK